MAGVSFEVRKSRKHINKVEKNLPKEITKAFQGHSTDSMDDYDLHFSMQDLFVAVEESWKNGDQK